MALQTQWRVGMAGRTGLDYAACLAYLRELGWRRKQRTRHWAGLRAMEAAALEVWADLAA